jgi:hypothetical protein
VPQGLPKKIEFNLLLADLAFQLTNALTSRSKRLRRDSAVALSPAINRSTTESLSSRLKTRRFAVDIVLP